MRIVKYKIASIAAAFLMACLAGAIDSTTPAENSKARHNEVVERVFSAWNSHDPEKVLGYYTDDVVYEDVPLGRTSHGKAELRKFVEDTFAGFPDLKVEVASSSICRGHGVSEVVWSATDKGSLKTDKRFSIRMVSVFELDEGKVSRNEDFYDLATIMRRQLGALPPDKTDSAHAGCAEQPDDCSPIQWTTFKVKALAARDSR
jgi:steroid delta-isomerase-like uncharacterized protein